MIRLPFLILLSAALLVACGGDDVVAPDSSTNDPLAALPPCGEVPGEPIELDLELTLPDTSVVLERDDQPPLTFVTAYATMTPPELRAWYEAAGDVELLLSEDEIFEVELLFSNGVDRAYLKGAATCRSGTMLTIVVAPELDGAPGLVPDGAFGGGSGGR